MESTLSITAEEVTAYSWGLSCLHSKQLRAAALTQHYHTSLHQPHTTHHLTPVSPLRRHSGIEPVRSSAPCLCPQSHQKKHSSHPAGTTQLLHLKTVFLHPEKEKKPQSNFQPDRFITATINWCYRRPPIKCFQGLRTSAKRRIHPKGRCGHTQGTRS